MLERGQSLSLLLGLLQLDELLDSIVHLLDSLVFTESESSLVRDVIHSSLALRVFSVDSAHLQIQLLADVLQYPDYSTLPLESHSR